MAENTLSSILDAIENVGSGIAALGLGILRRNPLEAARDGVAAAVNLANEEARQRQETENLRRKLADENWQLQLARENLGSIERRIQQAIYVIHANC